jgi:translation initiation factor IF-3
LVTHYERHAALHFESYSLRPSFLYKPNQFDKQVKTRINHAIRAKELRVVTDDGETLGVLSLIDALKAAEERNLDLIEISPNAVPPVAKIMDYGKFRYESGRKAREVKAKSHVTETKSVQVKIGTGEHDQQLKARRAAEWLEEGHRVKVDLFLWGRYKYMEQGFLKERLERFLKIIPTEYKVADEIKRSPKGFTITIERVPGASKNTQAPKTIRPDTAKEARKTPETGLRSKKKDLDDLLEGGMI